MFVVVVVVVVFVCLVISLVCLVGRNKSTMHAWYVMQSITGKNTGTKQ